MFLKCWLNLKAELLLERNQLQITYLLRCCLVWGICFCESS